VRDKGLLGSALARRAAGPTGLFLYINGYRLTASQADTTSAMLGAAAGDLSEDAFAAWLRQHCRQR
jgi:death-on-curing protein